MDFVCAHPGTLAYIRQCNTASAPGKIFDAKNKIKNDKYLAKSELINVTFMPMAFDVYGSWSVAFKDVFKKLAHYIADLRGSPVASVMSYWTARVSQAIYLVQAELFAVKTLALSNRLNGCLNPIAHSNVVNAALDAL